MALNDGNVQWERMLPREMEAAIRRYERTAELDAALRGGSRLSPLLVKQVRQANAAAVPERLELEWPGFGFRPVGILKAVFSSPRPLSE